MFSWSKKNLFYIWLRERQYFAKMASFKGLEKNLNKAIKIETFVRFIPFFVFRLLVKVTKKEKSAVLFVYFLYKKSSFCLKMTVDFFVFWSL